MPLHAFHQHKCFADAELESRNAWVSTVSTFYLNSEAWQEEIQVGIWNENA